MRIPKIKISRGQRANVRNATETLLRALGLYLIASGLRDLKRLAVGKGFDEQTKVAIRKSRKVALLRALIHLIPFTVALWEITINWNTYYLGSTPLNQAVYQFGAKFHEITAQASIAAIVFSYVRHEMSLGQGLPFGALFSGLQVSQLSYLWSMEFWGSICSKHLPLRRRIGMAVVITLAFVLAAAVGPSSAILLIPRLDYWPAGSTDIWVNITAQDLWPNRTDGSLVASDCIISDALSVNDNCPSSEWQAIQTFMRETNSLVPLLYQNYEGPVGPNDVQVTSRQSFRRLAIEAFIYPPDFVASNPQHAGFGSTQQAAVADALSSTATLWSIALSNVTTSGHGSVLDQLDAIHSITTDYYQPYSLVFCGYDTIQGQRDERPIAFPVLPGSNAQMLDKTEFDNSTISVLGFDFPHLSRSQILDTPGPLSENRLRWVELPQDPFNGTAIGAVILLPRSSNNITQEILVCNIGAGWGESTLNTSSFGGSAGPVQSEILLTNGVAKKISRLKVPHGTTPPTPSIAELVAGDINYGYFEFPVFPERPITLTETWANFPNPSLSYANTTVFDTLMTSNFTGVDISISAEVILAGLVANGLSRIGSTSQLQGYLKTVLEADGSTGLDGNYWFSGKGNVFVVDPIESRDWVKLHVSSVFQGYAYNTHGLTPKLAIGFLIAYCLLVLVHVLYAAISGISSTCWDSIGEVTALAVNSMPTTLLRNTCAGIVELGIFKLPVRVLAFRDEEGDGEHLELVFGTTDEKTVKNKMIKPNRVYGTMPAVKPREKML